MNPPGTTPHGSLRGQGAPTPCSLPVDQLSGDLLCPLCGEGLDIIIERTEHGAEPVGQCALCTAIVEIAL